MRDHHQLVRDLLKRGLEVAKTGGGHLMVRDGGDKQTVIPDTPGRGRSNRNTVATLRRVGLIDRPDSPGGTPKRGRRPEAPVRPYDGPRLPEGRIPRRRDP